MRENPRRRGEAQHVVDDGRLAEQALDRRQRRLGAHLAALAFQALEQRGLLAADIGAGAEPRLDVEGVAGAEHVGAQHAIGARLGDRGAERAEGVRIFGADIDVALGRADRERGDRHALDQEERVALHQHAVGESAAVALVGVADDVFLLRLDAGDRAPFDPGRKSRAAAPAQARERAPLRSCGLARSRAPASARRGRRARNSHRATADRRRRSARKSAVAGF